MNNFERTIKTIKNNKSKLLNFVGYTTINELKTDGGFETNADAFRYAKEQYNDFVKEINTKERNSIIINPLTNRKIKKYTLFTLDGQIRGKYYGKLILDEDNNLIKNPYIIGIDTDSNQIAKFKIDDADTPFLQQTFGFNINKNLIKDNEKVNNIVFKHTIQPDDEVMLSVRVNFKIRFSDDIEDKKVVRTRLFTGRQLSDGAFVMSLVLEDPVFSQYVETISISSVDILTTLNKATMTLENMILREAQPLNISSLFNEILHENKLEHCIHDYMFKIYPKHSKSEKQKEKIRKLNTTNDIVEWCKSYDIKMIAYDINGTVIKSHYPTKLKKLKNMIYLVFNNHLYPLKNKYLNKKKIDNYTISIIDNIKDELIKQIENGILPADIKISGDGDISSFIIANEDDTVCYTNNTEYYKCKEILEIFGLKDKLTIGTKISHLGNILDELYKQDINCNSFFPYGADFTKGAYNYTNEDLELEDNEIFYTIDKNKSYSYELAQLPYLIKCDIKYHKSKKINELQIKHKIIPHYLYIIDIDCPSLILPNNEYYEGHTLKIARDKGLNFRILEEQETEIVENYYKNFVNDLFNKVDNATFKEIMNIHIGKFETSSMKNDYLKFEKILGRDELNTFDGFTQPLTEDYYVGCKNKEIINIFNKKPISVQIKDRSRLRVFNMMNTLELKNTQIKQVKTDSITFKSINDDYKDYIHNELSGWKIEDFKEINKPCIQKRPPITFDYKSYEGNKYNPLEKNGEIGLGYAGNGKTYKIINEIIPKLEDNYIVLTPSHATIKEYRTNKFNCDVIQKYTFNNTIPEQQNIIVDEIGMVGIMEWNMLVRCKIAGKDIIVYGDNGQLSPVKSYICDNQNFYNFMFDNQVTLNTNYRNNFSKEYYDTLKQTNKTVCDTVDYYREKRLNEVLKHNTEYDKAECIIAYTNSTRKKYNDLMCEKLNIKSLVQPTAKIICKTNKLREYDIYNNFCFEVIENDGVEAIITDGVNKYTIEIIDIIKNFDYSYARTLYSVQGQTLNSFHYCIEDINWLGGRELYTLISRLKQ